MLINESKLKALFLHTTLALWRAKDSRNDDLMEDHFYCVAMFFVTPVLVLSFLEILFRKLFFKAINETDSQGSFSLRAHLS